MRGPRCERCSSDVYEAVKVPLKGTYCSECGACHEDRSPFAFSLDTPSTMPCGHDWMKSATIRTKAMMRCARCFQTMHEMAARIY